MYTRLFLFLVAAIAVFARQGNDGRLAAKSESWDEQLRNASQFQLMGRFPEAESAYLDALRGAQAADIGGTRLAVVLNNLGTLYSYSGRVSEAERMFRRSLALFDEKAPVVAHEMVKALSNLTALYLESSQFDRARKTIARLEAIHGTQPMEGLGALIDHNLGVLHIGVGEYREAEESLLRARNAYEALAGRNTELASVLNNLSTVYVNLKRPTDAEYNAAKAFGIFRTAYGDSSPEVLRTIVNLSTAYYLQERFETAEVLLKDALARAEQSIGPMQPITRQLLLNHAGVLERLRRKDEAKRLRQRAEEIETLLERPARHLVYAGEAAKH